MDTMIIVNNVGITLDDSIPAIKRPLAIYLTKDFVKTTNLPLIHVYAYMSPSNKDIIIDYLKKHIPEPNTEEINTNKAEENTKQPKNSDSDWGDENGNIRIINISGDEDDEELNTIITVNNVGITIDSSLPEQDMELAVSLAAEFVKNSEQPLIHVYLYPVGSKINVDYFTKITTQPNAEDANTNKAAENTKQPENSDADWVDENGNIRIIGDWGEEEEEPATPPAPVPAYPDRSQEILEAMEKVAHQTERVADELWWQSFNKSL